MPLLPPASGPHCRGLPWPLHIHSIVCTPFKHIPDAPPSARTHNNARDPATPSTSLASRDRVLQACGRLRRLPDPKVTPSAIQFSPTRARVWSPPRLASSSQTPHSQRPTKLPVPHEALGDGRYATKRAWGHTEGTGEGMQPVRTHIFGFPPPHICSASSLRRVIRAASILSRVEGNGTHGTPSESTLSRPPQNASPNKPSDANWSLSLLDNFPHIQKLPVCSHTSRASPRT